MSEEEAMQVPKLTVTYRGDKIDFAVEERLTVGDVKSTLSQQASGSIVPTDVKLLYKGKVLKDDSQSVSQLLVLSKKPQKLYRMTATGASRAEVEKVTEGLRNAPRLRDDLTPQGQQEMARRKELGLKTLQQARQKSGVCDTASNEYGFGRIETLPNLPDRDKARKILESLASDPGVLACMAKHKWNVGSLAELYPEGNVGKSAVCLMGLNKNNGAQILLRIRTDDLSGFRKILSIKEVLYHELAHNVHSGHDVEFFQLMRQIKKECTEMDWTQGAGLSEDMASTTLYESGSYRLGGSSANGSAREQAAQAALRRMQGGTPRCSCCQGNQNLFLPCQNKQDKSNHQ